MEEVHTWTHEKTRFNKENHHPRPPKHTPDHRVHGHFDAYMTGSSMKITIPDRPKTRHDQACELHSKMSVSMFGNLDIRRISISRTVSGPEVAAGWCKDALNGLLFCLSNRRISHRSAYSGIFAPRPLTRSYRPPASSSSAWTKIAMVTHQSEFSICGLANVTCSHRK